MEKRDELKGRCAVARPSYLFRKVRAGTGLTKMWLDGGGPERDRKVRLQLRIGTCRTRGHRARRVLTRESDNLDGTACTLSVCEAGGSLSTSTKALGTRWLSWIGSRI